MQSHSLLMKLKLIARGGLERREPDGQRLRFLTQPMTLLAQGGYHGVIPYFDAGRATGPDGSGNRRTYRRQESDDTTNDTLLKSRFGCRKRRDGWRGPDA